MNKSKYFDLFIVINQMKLNLDDVHVFQLTPPMAMEVKLARIVKRRSDLNFAVSAKSKPPCPCWQRGFDFFLH